MGWMGFADCGVEFNINLINNKTPHPENYYNPFTDQIEVSDQSKETIYVSTEFARKKIWDKYCFGQL